MPAIADKPLARRTLLVGVAALGTLAFGTLAFPRLAFAAEASDPVRRIVELASADALARLAQPNGFLDSRVARFGLPVLFRRGADPASPLGSAAFREQLIVKLNQFASYGAHGAIPAVARAARKLTVADPMNVLRGSPTAGTSLLRLEMVSDLINAMIQPIEEALTSAQDPLIAQAVAALPGVTLRDVAHAIALAADNGTWYEIGASEADIRANPAKTNDPALISALGAVRTSVPQP